MDVKLIYKFIEDADKKAQRAMLNYQETGKNGYYLTQIKNEELADALRAALKAREYIEVAQYLSGMVGVVAEKVERYKLLMDEDQKNILQKEIFEDIKRMSIYSADRR